MVGTLSGPGPGPKVAGANVSNGALKSPAGLSVSMASTSLGLGSAGVFAGVDRMPSSSPASMCED